MKNGLKRAMYILGGAAGGALSSAAFLKTVAYYKLASLETSGYLLGAAALALGSSVLGYKIYKQRDARGNHEINSLEL